MSEGSMIYIIKRIDHKNPGIGFKIGKVNGRWAVMVALWAVTYHWQINNE